MNYKTFFARREYELFFTEFLVLKLKYKKVFRNFSIFLSVPGNQLLQNKRKNLFHMKNCVFGKL